MRPYDGERHWWWSASTPIYGRLVSAKAIGWFYPSDPWPERHPNHVVSRPSALDEPWWVPTDTN